MKKKFNVWLLVLLFAFSVGMVEAQNANPPSDFDYDLNKEGTGVVIKKYKGKEKDVVIPSLIEGFPVVQLGRMAFYKSNIVSVVIPDSVILISSDDVDSYGTGCFYGCESLQKVTLSKNLKYIFGMCFHKCSSLKEITLPEGLEKIGYYAFKKSGLESITIPDSVSFIGDFAFQECENLKTVTIGNGVKIIEDYAFFECSALTTVTIGSGIKSIKEKAFADCSSLTTFNIGVEKLNSGESFYINNKYYDTGYYYNVFNDCSSLSLKEKKKIRDTGYRGEF